MSYNIKIDRPLKKVNQEWIYIWKKKLYDFSIQQKPNFFKTRNRTKIEFLFCLGLKQKRNIILYAIWFFLLRFFPVQYFLNFSYCSYHFTQTWQPRKKYIKLKLKMKKFFIWKKKIIFAVLFHLNFYMIFHLFLWFFSTVDLLRQSEKRCEFLIVRCDEIRHSTLAGNGPWVKERKKC